MLKSYDHNVGLLQLNISFYFRGRIDTSKIIKVVLTCENSLSEQKVTHLFTAIIRNPIEQSHRVFVTESRAMLNFWVILQKRNIIPAAIQYTNV